MASRLGLDSEGHMRYGADAEGALLNVPLSLQDLRSHGLRRSATSPMRQTHFDCGIDAIKYCMCIQ